MLFLVNAPKGRRRKKKAGGVKRERLAQTKRTKVKARRSVSSISGTRRMGATMAVKKKRKVARKKTASRARPAARKGRKKTTARRKAVTTLRRRAVYMTNPRKGRRRRSVRRNPSFSASGILSTLKRSGMDAAAILGGMAATNFIARKIPYGDGNRAMEVAKKIAVALGLGMVARKAVGSSLAEKIIVGGMVAVGVDLLRGVPTIGTALAGDDDLRFLSRGMGSYADMSMAQSGDEALGAWPQSGIAQKGALDGYYN